MQKRIVTLADREAALAAKGELRAMVRVKPWIDWMREGVVCCKKGKGMVIGMVHSLSPFGAPGDVLMGRETWTTNERIWDDDRAESFMVPAVVQGLSFFRYRIDGEIKDARWRSPVTMPSWAIRRRFTVKSVRACQAKLFSIMGVPVGCREEIGRYIIRHCNEETWIWYAELDKI